MSLTEGQRERIKSEALRGTRCYAEVARAYGVSPQTVYGIVRRAGVEARWHRWTPEEDELLRRHYRELGPRGMVPMLPRHPNHQSICHRARKLGLGTAVGPYGRRRSDG